VFCGEAHIPIHTEIPCGSGLAREGGGTVTLATA